jgi:biuret amidohydrolase
VIIYPKFTGVTNRMRVKCDQNQSFEFNPASSALLCIDYQMDFLSEKGLCAERELPIDVLRRTLAPSRRVLAGARAGGMKVLHTRECYAPDLSDLNAFRRERDTIIGVPGPLGRFLVRGEPGTAIVPEMAPAADEPVINKPGFSAFFGTHLDELLRESGISHLVLVGVTTQVCISSTLRAAVDYGYFPLLLEDCCAAWDLRDHEASIRIIFSENHQFGWVSDSTRFLDSL